jgi:membrane associated rhomboid family serine protease
LAEFNTKGAVVMKSLALFPLILVAYVLGWIALGLAFALNALAEALRHVAGALIGFLNWATD